MSTRVKHSGCTLSLCEAWISRDTDGLANPLYLHVNKAVPTIGEWLEYEGA